MALLTSCTTSFKYSAIDETNRDIRLFEIEPTCDKTSPIKCSLSVHSLNDDPRYIALSYTWGNPTDTEAIYLDGCRFLATKNLVALLSEVRLVQYKNLWHEDHDMPKYIWADSLCINQTDKVEQSSQVALMGELYRRSAKTLCWLGTSTHDSDLGLHALSQIGRYASNAEIVQKDLQWSEVGEEFYHIEPWTAVYNILHRPYWDRVWTYQEMVLPENAVWVCGHANVDFHHALNGAQWLLDSFDHPRPECVDRDVWVYLQIHLRDALGTLFRIRGARELVRLPKYEDPWVVAMNTAVCYISITSRSHLKSSDVRDKIYGFLGAFPLPIRPDYNKSRDEVFLDIAQVMIKAGLAFLVLLGAGISETYGKLGDTPSWVPRWDYEDYRDEGAFVPREDPLEHQVVYDDYLIRLTGSHTLILRATHFDQIVFVGDSPRKLGLLESLCQIFQQIEPSSRYPTGITNFEAVFRVLVRDVHGSSMELLDTRPSEIKGVCVDLLLLLLSWPSGCERPASYTMADKLQDCASCFGLRTDRRLSEQLRRLMPCLFQDDRPSGEEVPQKLSIAELAGWRKYSNVGNVRHMKQILDSRFVLTTSGYIGLASSGVSVRDCLVVSPCCFFPLVLRKASTSHDKYQYIGPSYVHGCMDSAANGIQGIRQEYEII